MPVAADLVMLGFESDACDFSVEISDKTGLPLEIETSFMFCFIVQSGMFLCCLWVFLGFGVPGIPSSRTRKNADTVLQNFTDGQLLNPLLIITALYKLYDMYLCILWAGIMFFKVPG